MRNFEKNIKTKADAFQMNPSPGSFDKVMASIEKEKKRRSIFWLWILIPGILVAASCSIWIYQLSLSGSIQPTTIAQQTGDIRSKNTTGKKKINEQKTYLNITSGHSENRSFNENQESIEKDLLPKNNTSKKPQHNPIQNKVKVTEEKKSSNVSTKDYHLTIENNQQQNATVVTQNIDQNNQTLFSLRNKELFITTNKIIPCQLPSVNNSLGLYPNRILTSFNYPHPIIKPEKFNRFSLGIYADLGVSKNIFTDYQKDSISTTYYAARSQTDVFLFSYSAGLQFRYSPLRFLAIETGIGFTHYESNQVVMDAGITLSAADLENFPDTALTLFSSNPISKEYRNTYDYISIPVKVYYQKTWNWVGVEAGGGVIFDIPVNTHSYVANENNGYSFLENSVDKSRLNKFGLQVSANINMVFRIKQFGVFMGPTFKYRVNSMFDNNYIIQQQNYFIGGTIGARYHF